ncbi:MAG: ParB/RepB/Spo0J family partition protein [Patescibacteria group bacterium]|nr:ParB/RepB/Spo0J family partition protein [Patescibacteria group bacterium]
MARKKTGLGRGLGALIPQETKSDADVAVKERPKMKSTVRSARAERGRIVVAEAVNEIKLTEIVANPEQPRISFSHQELENLTESIREHGILQPLAVTPKDDGGYEIIAGERRFRAAKMAGLKSVPVIVRKTEGGEKLVLALIENIQREDLNPIEEARAYERLTREFDMTQEEVAKKVGKGRSTVANIMRLLDLPEEMRRAVESGMVSAGSARALLGIADEKERVRMFRKVIGGKMTTRDIEAGARKVAGKSEKDPSLAAIEEELRGKYGTKVSVSRREGRGKIAMTFYSEEEYKNLIDKLLQ